MFESVLRYGKIIVGSETCVFISHNSRDKPMARAIAATLTEAGIFIYYDEHDKLLQTAAGSNDNKSIVKCIEDGLDCSSHLLGLITKATYGSWWVPYEIGGASGRSKKCAHIIAADVYRLPAYINIAPVLLDIDDLFKWASSTILYSSKTLKELSLPTSHLPRNKDTFSYQSFLYPPYFRPRKK